MNGAKTKMFQKLSLAFLLFYTAALTFVGSWAENMGNRYYTAAIESMLQNFHNFFFVAFDPGGFVSVDKPPVALWIQTIFARVFGLHSWSILLPESIAAVLSVALLYRLVKRTFGFYAGITAALALACTPIFIAVSRTNNLDSILVLDMILSAYLLIKSAENGKLAYLAGAMALAGIGFNIKMLEAYLFIPAFYCTFFFAARGRYRKRLFQLAAATIVLVMVSFSWVLAVDLTPAADRPYVGSSQTNSEMELAFGYNGFRRAFGTIHIPQAGRSIPAVRVQRTRTAKKAPVMKNSVRPLADKPHVVSTAAPPASVFRLFDRSLGGQIGWFIPISLFGIAAFFIWYKRHRAPSNRGMFVNAVFWASCVASQLVFFSIADMAHRYYMSVMAPGLAAFTGIGLVFLWKLYREKGFGAALLPLSLVVTAAVQVVLMLADASWDGWLAPAVAAVCTVCAAALGIAKVYKLKLTLPVVSFALAAGMLFAAPAMWASTSLFYGTYMGDPHADPPAAVSSKPVKVKTADRFLPKAVYPSRSAKPVKKPQNNSRRTQPSVADMRSITRFLQLNRGRDKYMAAVLEADDAEGMILNTGLPVMVVGGFSGNDPILTLPAFERQVQRGDVRFFLLNTADTTRKNIGIVSWVKRCGRIVPEKEILRIKSGGASGGNGRAGKYILFELQSDLSKPT